MAEKRLIDANELLISFGNALNNVTGKIGYGFMEWVVNEQPTVDPENLRPVAHWEEIPGSYVTSAGKSGSWCVPATRCTNQECGEVNPCGLKTPFCPMCGFRMEDVPYDDD